MSDTFEILTVNTRGLCEMIGHITDTGEGIDVSLNDQLIIKLTDKQDLVHFLEQYFLVNDKYYGYYHPFLVSRDPEYTHFLEANQQWELHMCVRRSRTNSGLVRLMLPPTKRSDLFDTCRQIVDEIKEKIQKDDTGFYEFHLVVEHVRVHVIFIHIDGGDQIGKATKYHLNVKSLNSEAEIAKAINKICSQIYIELCETLIPMLNI